MPKLTNITLKQLAGKPSRHSDAQTKGLYLQVRPTGATSWLYRYQESGKERMAGLGAFPLVSLQEARVAALALAKVRHDGLDPLTEKRQAKIASAAVQTFAEAAEAYIVQMGPSWAKGRDFQWRSSLRRYAYPTIGRTPVGEITTDQVLAVLTPIWTRVPETSSKLRGRIAAVIDAAAARSGSERANPGRWAGHLSHILPNQTGRIVRHHPALPYADAPGFYRSLLNREGVVSRMLAFTMLTACRSGEARLAVWSEISADGAMWIVPAARSKTRKEHRIPLSEPARDILDEMRALRRGVEPTQFIFPSKSKSRPLSIASMISCLRRRGQGHLTVHGMRSTFRDWCAERTDTEHAVVELSLAHSVGAVERAYRRSDLLVKRAELMTAWGAFLAGSPTPGG